MPSYVAIAAAQHRLIRERLQATDPDIDEKTLSDTVEGLTDLYEIVAAIVRSALEDEALAKGLEVRVEALQVRLDRLQDRATKRRQIARDAMVESNLKKITSPDFTLTIRPGSPALVVLEEAAIPSEFWKPQAPRLDRQILLAELKKGAMITGVALSNPEPVLSVRTK
jgi:hypothetical protein